MHLEPSLKTKKANGDINCLAIYAPNSPEWVIADLACQANSLATVALYDTLGPDSVEFILNHTKAPVALAALKHIPTLIKLKSQLPNLNYIVSITDLNDFDGVQGQSKLDLLNAWANDVGVKLISMKDVENIGASNPFPNIKPTADTVSTINYTSGTTGMPKVSLYIYILLL